MPKAKADPYAGYTLLDPNAQPAPRAELIAKPDVSTIVPNIQVHDPATYAGLTADHAVRTLNAQGVAMTGDQYVDIFKKAQEDANQYRERQAEAAPGGIEEQKAQLAAKTELLKKQAEQGPSAVAEAARRGALPGQTGGTTGLISAPDTQQKKDWPAYIEGFHNLQDLHKLFDSMATNTAGAGGPGQSLLGLTTKLTDITSPQARVYHAYVESSLIPLAKSIMGDAATTAGKETVQGTMIEALPTNVDTIQTGGQKMFMFYKRALDKVQTERDFARKNGVDTSSIDSDLNDFHSFFNSPEVQKYNPLTAQPLVQGGTSDTAKATTQNVAQGALAGTNQTATTQTATTQPVANQGNVAPPPIPAPPEKTYPPITSDPGTAEAMSPGARWLIESTQPSRIIPPRTPETPPPAPLNPWGF